MKTDNTFKNVDRNKLSISSNNQRKDFLKYFKNDQLNKIVNELVKADLNLPINMIKNHYLIFLKK